MKSMRAAMPFIVTLLGILLIASCAGTRHTESTGEYFDDSTITTKVKTAILEDPTLKLLDISVETFKGIVQLSGFVNSTDVRNQAAVVASNVKGVKSVKNNLIVK